MRADLLAELLLRAIRTGCDAGIEMIQAARGSDFVDGDSLEPLKGPCGHDLDNYIDATDAEGVGAICTICDHRAPIRVDEEDG